MNNFDKINLEKGMYLSGNLSDVLESMDPSENYYGTPLQDLDAFSRQLKRYDIKVSGVGSDTVEKFFATSNSAVLFPEYVRRCVQIGIDDNNIVQDIVANTINIDGFDYRSVSAQPDKNSLRISTYDSLVPIKKHGKSLQTSYESLRFQRISTLTTILQQIGCYIAMCQYQDAVELFGDSRSIGRKRPEDIISSFTTSLYRTGGYKLTTLLCTMSEFTSMQASQKNLFVVKDDKMYYGETKILSYPHPQHNGIIGIDNRYAVEMIKCGDVKVDYEKLIDRKFENAEICSHAGFSIVCPDAIASAELVNFQHM